MYPYLEPDINPGPQMQPPKKLTMKAMALWTFFSMALGFCATFTFLSIFVFPTSLSSMFSPTFLFAAAGGADNNSPSVAEKTAHAPEPAIERIEASDELVPGDTITVVFNMEMGDKNASPLIFDMLGEGQWLDPKTYQFTVGEISPNQTYTMKLLQGFVAKDGSVVTHDDVRELHSAKPVQASFISEETEYNAHTPIKIIFDQPVDEASAEKAFHIVPSAKGSFKWDENTLIFTPAKLGFQTTYRITMSAGIKAFHGFPSISPTTLTIETSPEITKLNVPYFQQQYKTSCEASALRMALAYYKISANDIDIVREFGYNPRPRNRALNEWDDPHKMFVGEVDVSDINKGYGVYGEPVAKAAENFGRKASYRTSITPAEIAEEIRAGHPIVMWGYTSLTLPTTTWNTPGGGTATVLKGEHARTIVGVKGSTSNPLGFYVHDPANGNKFEYWSVDRLMGQFNSVPGVTNQAVIVS